jgi:HEAT repeat protein
MDGGLSLDTRLLSDAIIELNISRHNVSIYPRNHPIVDKSLRKAFDHFAKLFEFSSEITVSVAKDTLIVYDQALDKKHPVYREFALSLSNRNIASVTFMKGLSLDELYSFHQFLIEETGASTSEQIRNRISEYGFKHIRMELIDYSAFILDAEGGGDQESGEKVSLWEKYVYGLLHGSLDTGGDPAELREVSPEALAAAINRIVVGNISSESYDKVISSYVRKTSEMAFTAGELHKLIQFIDNLRPELKRQFLSSSMHAISQDIESARKALSNMAVDEVIHLLELANEQMITIPDALKNIMEKFAMISRKRQVFIQIGTSMVDDDIHFSEEMSGLLREADFKQFVSETYRKEILKIIDYDTPAEEIGDLKKYDHQWSDEYLDGVLHHILLDLISPERADLLTDDDRRHFMGLLIQKAEALLETGRFIEIIHTILALEELPGCYGSDSEEDNSLTLEIFHSPAFLKKAVDAIRIIGRQTRESVFVFCDYFGEKIIPFLLDSLIEEESQAVRRFLITLIVRAGTDALPSVTALLDDDRWFVKRNMLFILSELIEKHPFEDALIKKIRKLCRYPNLKVSTEALKCLMKTGDEYGVKTLREHLTSDDDEVVRKALTIAGNFRVKDVVPDLVQMLSKKAIKGADLDDKIPVVRALGRIADPRALPALNDILSMKSIFYRGRLEKLKAEATEALKQFSKREDEVSRKVVAAS